MLCDNFMVSCINHKKMLTDNTPREDAIPEIRARRRTPGKVTYCVAGFPGGRTSRPDLLLSQTVYRFWVTDYPDQKNPSVTNRKVHCRMTEPATKHKKRSPFNGKTFFYLPDRLRICRFLPFSGFRQSFYPINHKNRHMGRIRCQKDDRCATSETHPDAKETTTDGTVPSFHSASS